MIVLDVLVCVLMILAGVTAVLMRNLVAAAVLVGVVSLMVSILFLRMGAPDVAMTEASIGAGLSTVIFLIAVRRTGEEER
ncbi:MAG: hydrogenase subunit MbhD domain-containing protein [Planctomycetota bacterium]